MYSEFGKPFWITNKDGKRKTRKTDASLDERRKNERREKRTLRLTKDEKTKDEKNGRFA
jgi:hypothetical protein